MIEQGPDIAGDAWRQALVDVFGHRAAKQEDVLRKILQGKARLSDWPVKDTQLAQCRTCMGFRILALVCSDPLEPRCFNADFLAKIYAYDWQCDACQDAAD